MGIILVNLFFINLAFAIPTFARKYRTSCGTCHIGFQKPTPFGETFRQNGYQIPAGDAAYIKEEPVKLGADAWKKVWPKQTWPGEIPSQVPIAFYAHQRIFVDENKVPATTNFKFPHEFKLFTAGTTGDLLSFWGEYNLQSSTLNRLFAQFNDLFLKDSGGRFAFLPEDALNLRIGRLDVGTIGFPINLRRTINKPLPYTYTVADGWDLADLQSGLEVNGVLKSRFKYALGLVNGPGAGLTGAGSTGTPSGVEDENDKKDVYGRIAYKFGGLSFDGKDWGQEAELKQTDNWVDNAITLGLFGYWGTSTVGTTSLWENDFRRLGFDYRFNFGNLDIYGAYVRGVDKSPASTKDGLITRGTVGGVDSFSWFVEADYVFYPWLSAVLGYEQVTYDKAFSRDIDALYASLLIWPRANIRLTLEGRVLPENKDGNSQLFADLTYAF